MTQVQAGPRQPALIQHFKRPQIEMTKNAIVVLYVLALIAVVVGVDFLFLRDRFWLRLFVNIGIVLTFAAIYFGLLKTR
jgi:hypothetical protein